MSEEFRARPIHLVAVFGITGLACVLDYVASKASMPSGLFVPFGSTPTGMAFSALLLILLLWLVSVLIYLLVKRGLKTLVRFLVGFALVFVSFTVTNFYLVSVLEYFHALNERTWWLAYLLPVLLVIAIVRSMILGKELKGLVAGVLGSCIGAFLAFMLPTITIVLLVLLLILYDIYAVYKGPIKKMLEEGETIGELSFEIEGLEIGLGDSVFYAMLPAHFLVYFGFSAGVASVIGIILGTYVSLKFLEKAEFIPGLPIAMGFGLLGAFLGSLI